MAICLLWSGRGPSSIAVVVHAQTPPTQGQWSAVQPWPAVAVHAHLLPTGKVLFWPYSDEPRLWDPQTGAITAAANSGFNLFCTGHSFLADGRLFVAGGHISNSVGLPTAAIYDAFANSWTRLPNMNAGRWYPTVTTLASGDALIVSGEIDEDEGFNRLPQVLGMRANALRNLGDAEYTLPLYPFMHLAPNGKVFNAGPNQSSLYFDIHGRGTHDLSSPSRLLRLPRLRHVRDVRAGEGAPIGGHGAPTNTAEVINLNAHRAGLALHQSDALRAAPAERDGPSRREGAGHGRHERARASTMRPLLSLRRSSGIP